MVSMFINVQRPEQRPYGESDIDNPTSKVESSWETGNHLKARIRPTSAGRVRLGCGGGVELDEVTSTKSWVREDIRDRSCGTARPRRSEPKRGLNSHAKGHRPGAGIQGLNDNC